MISLTRIMLPAILIITSSLIYQSQNFLRETKIEQLQKTRKCFACNLSGIDLSGANLEKVDLRSVNLQEANLTNANLRYANLEWGDLRYANLQGADLTKANLKSTIFVNANLQGANLAASNLSRTNFRNANLSRANLLGALRDDDDIESRPSLILCKTILPNGKVSNRNCSVAGQK